MIKTYRSNSRSYLNWVLKQSAIVALSTLSLLAGVTPDLSKPPTPSFNSSAYAQGDEVQRYARAAYAIELRRQSVAEQVKKITGGNVPDIACNQSDRLDSFPANVRSIFVDFCNFSRETIERNGLTVARFNEIMAEQKSNTDLQRRIDAELLRLQKNSLS